MKMGELIAGIIGVVALTAMLLYGVFCVVPVVIFKFFFLSVILTMLLMYIHSVRCGKSIAYLFLIALGMMMSAYLTFFI